MPRTPRILGIGLDKASAMTLDQSCAWVRKIPPSLPEEARLMSENIVESFLSASRRLIDLGLNYLSLDRAASTLSNGERQRMQLARAARGGTTGALYVLDEPSIGLHAHNLNGVFGIMRDLISDGNTVILVDHDCRLLAGADWLIEMGPGAGARGGEVISQGTIKDTAANKSSIIGPFLSGPGREMRKRASRKEMFKEGAIELESGPIYTVKPLEVKIPLGRLTAVTGVSGSGKTTLIIESLLPALQAAEKGAPLPSHVKGVRAPRHLSAKLIDSSPIGANIRSTVATYINVHDELRKIFARSADARKAGFKAGDFSYNTGRLRCLVCDGQGIISLDVQFLPDVNVSCPECRGSRYSKKAREVRLEAGGKLVSLPEIMAMDAETALQALGKWKNVKSKLEILNGLGLGYLALGEGTPGLSGGEAQRLKLAEEMGKIQSGSVFIFDEPAIGLHPLDVQTLINVIQSLLDKGATVIVIEHDLDFIRSADYIIDMGPGGGDLGGEIIAAGLLEDIAKEKRSLTGRYL